MLDRLRREDFEPLLGQTLPLRIGTDEVSAELVDVRALASPSPRAEPFSFVLRVPGHRPAAQGVYALAHPVHGALELFMVPIARDAHGTRYEVIFN
jgi:hypothetical protein